jgi:hypothetical protein
MAGRKEQEFTPDQIALASRLHKAGKNTNRIAMELGVHFNTAARLIRKLFPDTASVITKADPLFKDVKPDANRKMTKILMKLLKSLDVDSELEKLSAAQKGTLAAILTDKLVDKYENEGKQIVEYRQVAEKVTERLNQISAAREIINKYMANLAKPEGN